MVLADRRTLLIHYWLVSTRGGEAVLAEVARLFPNADILTHVRDKAITREVLGETRPVRTTWVGKLPGVTHYYKSLLSLMMLALEQEDLSSYDLIVSFESGPSRQIVRPARAVHVCYCHTPMRYVWDMRTEYRKRLPFLARLLWDCQLSWLRQHDIASLPEVDGFIANSRNVQERIWKHYRREARVVYPPVDVSFFNGFMSRSRQDYFVYVGQLDDYKRPHELLQLYDAGLRPIRVVGAGPRARQMRARVGLRDIQFLGRLDREAMATVMGSSRALLFPGDEDFGIVPVEALATGTPVVGLRKGGILETVVDGVSGVLYDEGGWEVAARRFLELEGYFEHSALQQRAARFSRERFQQEFVETLDAFCQ